MNKLKGVFETFPISKHFGRFHFQLARSFRYVKKFLVLKKDNSENFLAIRKNKNTSKLCSSFCGYCFH